MSKIRIVSDGTPKGTKVFARQGFIDTALDGVLKIEFMPLEHGTLLQARITFECPEVDALAEWVEGAAP